MIQKSKVSAWLSALLLLGMVNQAAADDKAEGRWETSKYLADRQAGAQNADKLVRRANDAFDDGEYQPAIELYIEAKKQWGTTGSALAQEKIKYCDEQIRKAYFEIANEALKAADKSAEIKDFDDAISKCREVIKMYPESKDEMEKKIAKYEKMRRRVELKNATKPETLLGTSVETREYEIQVLLLRGREYAKRGEYSKARRAFREVLTIDPYRSDATQDLLAVNKRIADTGRWRADVDHRRLVAQSNSEWLRPIRAKTQTVQPAISDNPVEKTPLNQSLISQKLNSIIIKNVDFTDTALETAIKYLRRLSKSSDPEQVGINIFLNLGNEEDAAKYTGKTLNFTMENRTLGDAIKLLCEQAGLRYRIEKYAVVIESPDLPESNMEMKIFPFDAQSTVGSKTNSPEELKKYFEDLGVRFPVGSTIRYDQRLGRIIATNTMDNLNMIEAVINESQSTSEPMVQILLRFVEVNQEDLNTLGFNYTVSANDNPATFTEGGTNNGTGLDTSTVTATNNVVGNFTVGNFTINANIVAINNMNTNDILASPRVVTMNGQPATVKLVRQIYFVTDWEASDTDNTNDVQTYIGPFPNFDPEPTELGITFTVTPTVDMTRRTITMKLEPEISEFNRFIEFTGTDSDGNIEYMKMPELTKRSVINEVTISDGQTLVLGGITKDKIQNVVNKVPILGDVPLFGRMFQTKSKLATKQYLLIFITPQLIKPDGTSFFPNSGAAESGLPSFE